MKCKCGSIVTISEDNFAKLNDNFVITCTDCNRAYSESDFSELEVEKAYWSKLPTETDKKQGGK